MIHSLVLILLIALIGSVVAVEASYYGLVKSVTPPNTVYEELEAEFDFGLDLADAFMERKIEMESSVARLPVHIDAFVEAAVSGRRASAADYFSMDKDSNSMGYAVAQRRELASDKSYNNPDDKYEQSSNVKNGAAISGVDFDPTAEYIQSVLVKPILLFCLGFVSLFFFNIALCCRCCCKCCQCKPNDHHTEKGHEMDSHDTRERYIIHQKQMVLGIELTLIFAVLLADTLCFYGYTYMQEGASKLNEAFDLLLKIFQNVELSVLSLKNNDVPELTAAKDAAKVSCSNGANAMESLDGLCIALAATSDTLLKGVQDLLKFIVDGKTYVNDFLAANIRPFVFVVWALGAISTLFFIIFRVCANECGTKLAIFWGELTFFIILLVNVPLMIFSQIIGDFCVQPTHNTLSSLSEGSSLYNMVYFYSHCNGTDTIRDNLLAVNNTFAEISNATSYLQHAAVCNNNPDITQIQTNISAAGLRFGEISGYIACSNFQEVWFKLMNEAFCGGFYSGIYSLWVSQFITSLFLFFLIVCASVSYQYFKPNSQIVVDNEHVEGSETVKYAEAEPFGESEKPLADGDAYDFSQGKGDGGGGEYEMTDQGPSEGAGEDGDDII